MQCPECWLDNESDAKKCKGCGHKFLPERTFTKRRTSGLGDYFDFRELITPALIKLFYALGAFVLSAGSLISIFSPHIIGKQGVDPVRAVLFLILGNVLWRMVCEAVILIFSVHEVLVSLDQKAESLISAIGPQD
jgi:hypothetical protein